MSIAATAGIAGASFVLGVAVGAVGLAAYLVAALGRIR